MTKRTPGRKPARPNHRKGEGRNPGQTRTPSKRTGPKGAEPKGTGLRDTGLRDTGPKAAPSKVGRRKPPRGAKPDLEQASRKQDNKENRWKPTHHPRRAAGQKAKQGTSSKTSRTSRDRSGAGIEATVLPGLIPAARQELTTTAGVTQVRKIQGEDALTIDGTAQLERLEAARTISAVWLRRTYAVPRPKALLGDEALRSAAADLQRVAQRHAFTGLRLEAAGRDTATLARLADAYAQAAGLPHDPSGGDLVVRLRPSTHGSAGNRRSGGSGRPGSQDAWDVLIRTTPRPLSTRPWRAADRPGSLNANVAAALWLHAGVTPDERILNPACGGGTLLAERLATGPAAFAYGFDVSADALADARSNLAGVPGGPDVHLQVGDLQEPGWGLSEALGLFDTIVCDPPWGDAVGSKQEADALHEALLKSARAHLKPSGRLLLVTHAIKTTDRLLAEGDWTVVSDRRVFAGGHRPRLLHLKLAR